MPDVAYVAVINEQGAAVVGVFGEVNHFDLAFYAKAKENGFPAQVLRGNAVGGDHLEKNAKLIIGGQKVHDKVFALREINGELHVGLFIGSIDKSLQDALLSPLLLTVVSVPWIAGLLAFFLLARYITTPLKDLTAIVHRISLGELDLIVEPHGPRELRDFARAFERMRYSIREAINRLKSS
jgi:methyl-accepting chemotaxis protein